MNNVRGLYPPLYGATPSGGGGGGGGGQHIQVDTLPEASLANKDKIVQYVGTTTEPLTNAYFYKCVENTGYDWEETEASETYTEVETLPTASAETIGTIYKVGDKYYQTIIVLTYSWDNIDVMIDNGVVLVKHEYSINLTGTNNWYALDSTITNNNTDFVIGSLQITTPDNVVTYFNGYSDTNVNVQIYVANDSGLSFYGRAADVTAGSTFKVIAFVKEKEV